MRRTISSQINSSQSLGNSCYILQCGKYHKLAPCYDNNPRPLRGLGHDKKNVKLIPSLITERSFIIISFLVSCAHVYAACQI